MKVLVINAGSSSIKYYLYRMPESEVLAHGLVEKIGEETSRLSHYCMGRTHTRKQRVGDVETGIELILDTLADPDVGAVERLSEVRAVGHRVVHGGELFTGSVIIDAAVIESIRKFADLAPLHNPHNLAGIRTTRRRLPQAVQVGCFDTAFHATIPGFAYLYALPYDLYEKHHIRRYGFHGISHRYVARRAAALMHKGKYDINAITCHLGNGCSLTAVKKGRSIDTSMGFTPLEGVPMGTRCGDLDPAILFYLADKGYGINQLKTICNEQSGLLGISRLSNDVRNLQELAAAGDSQAALAIDVFCYRVRKYIGAYAAVLATVDAIVFTGGIGENAPMLRERICADLIQIGVRLDPDLNAAAVAREAVISTNDSPITVFAIPTNEQVAIAKDTYKLAAAQMGDTPSEGCIERPAVEKAARR
ncbi:MAG: acetate kinase [Phycisphaerales bacterium]|nr:MAG: acetate kinase [Phycisphaerales bacterium]